MVYDSNPVPVTYTKEELASVIEEYLKDVTLDFSFRDLCYFIIEKAIIDGKVRDAKNTHYSSREMNPLSSIEVSKYLWNLIWEHKIMVAFGENPYAAHSRSDTRFIINK